MQNTVKSRLQSLQFGQPQIYKNIAIVPLLAPKDGTFQYDTLGEALAAANLTITEISTAGSVPELMVVNRSQRPVLLVDGEEVAGAKQNRVLNTSILIKEGSETKIPVSCTEQGRWSYSSAAFTDSGHIMAHKSRSSKVRSVHYSLESSGQYQSDQSEVWANIAELHAKAGTRSPTSAMSDVFKARHEDLRKSDEVFAPVANQVGLVAFIGGSPAGADMVSLTSAYAKLHPKLVRSYALEGILEPFTSPRAAEGRSEMPPPLAPETITALAHQFLDEISAAEERQFPSIGHGTDFRYRTVTPMPPEGGPATPPSASQLSAFQHFSVCGSALVHQNEVIHAAFFRLDETETEQIDRMASYRFRRRRFTE